MDNGTTIRGISVLSHVSGISGLKIVFTILLRAVSPLNKPTDLVFLIGQVLTGSLHLISLGTFRTSSLRPQGWGRACPSPG